MTFATNLSALMKLLVSPASYIKSKFVFGMGCLFSITTLIVTILHYQNKLTMPNTLWIFWLLSMGGLIAAFSPCLTNIKNYWRYSNNKTVYWIFIGITATYFPIRLFHYSTSPWNNYGLFDDAAWDIYFAKVWMLFSDSVFQGAFLDRIISKETMFHYYIMALFELFGYNLFTFNMGLAFLGFITVLFTTLTIHKIFNRPWITAVGAIIIITFPLHVTQTFMGHRYAIVVPLMTISYYYLLSGFKNDSALQAVIGGIFAGLCVDGAHLGKQYVVALLLSIPFIILFSRKEKIITDKNFSLTLFALLSFLISLIPLLVYIYFNSTMYFGRERGLFIEGFLTPYQTQGMSFLVDRLSGLASMFFQPSSGYRMFMEDYPLISYIDWVFLAPGLIILIYKKRWEILIMCFLPAFICLLTTGYDFRVQISTPFWIITMLYAVDYFSSSHKPPLIKIKPIVMACLVLCIGVGVVSSARYILHVSSSPNLIRLLGHVDVAFARMAQDIIRGNENNPSIALKHDEFNPPGNIDSVPYVTMVCPNRAFAVAYLFFQNFSVDKKFYIDALTLCNGQTIDILQTPQALLEKNIKAINERQTIDKDLMLVWEVSPTSQPVIDQFKKFNHYGYDKTYTYEIDGIPINVWALKIKKENINKFVSELKSLHV